MLAGCGTVTAPADAYRNRLKVLKVRLARLDRVGGHLANGRVITILLALGLAVAVVFGRLPVSAWWAAGAAFVAFLALGTVHSRVSADERRAQVQTLLNERGLKRLSGQWRGFANTGERYLDPAHLYSADLDVFGQGSLFQQLDETGTRPAEEMLASWLSTSAPPAAIRERQAAVRELSHKLEFRQALVTEAKVASETKADPRRFLEWVEGESGLEGVAWLTWLAWWPLLTVALWFFATQGWVPPIAPLLSLLVQGVLAGIGWRACNRFYRRIEMGESGLVRFEGTFAAIERERVESPLLTRLKQGLDTAGLTVAQRLKNFTRLYAFAELKSSGQYHALINVLLLWDIQVLFRLDRWRRQQAQHARGWFESLAQLEGLAALGTYAAEHPAFVYPVVDDGPARLTAVGLGHPLIDEPVRNDIAFEAPSTAYVITGSNMSGKTTLLRAIGLNAVMAQAGLPVSAQNLQMSPLVVLTSMRVKDSLERGVSYFYAEVQRIKAVLDAAAAHPQGALFLLDELLMGTNTKERQVASGQLLNLLLDTGAIGAITTHDLSLTQVGRAGLRNVHFRDLVENDRMEFDYRLREGVVETTNALRLLRAAGVPMP